MLSPAVSLIHQLAPWQLATPAGDGNQLDASLYAAQDRAATERALAEALKLNGELVADRDTLRADRDRLRDELADANELVACLQEQLAAARPECER